MKTRAIKKVIYVVWVILVGYLVIYLTGMARWERRLFVLSLLVLCANIWMLWYGINPSTKMMSADPQFDKNRKRHETELRIVVVVFALLMAYWMTLPLVGDLIGLARGAKLIVRTDAVALHEVGGTADRFIYQSVEFSTGGRVEAYTFFFYPGRTRSGGEYDFVALPRTHIILDCHESQTRKGKNS